MHRSSSLTLVVPLLAGCLVSEDLYERRRASLQDQDGDGSPGDRDCDDRDPSRAPGLDEVCDGVDNDCNGTIDDNAVDAATWFVDADTDGAGSPDQVTVSCTAPPYHVDTAGDCDDGDAAVGPHTDEICNDQVDNDCDGTPNDCGWVGTVSVADADVQILGASAGDGFGLVLATGDVDNDGVSDLVSGALHGNEAVVVPGAALSSTVYLGAASDRVRKASDLPSTYRLAQSLGLCDVSGDGRDDLLLSGLDLGATSELLVFEGPITGSQSTADAALVLRAAGTRDFLGNAFACGDFNGDGAVDLVTAAALADTERGAAYLLQGPLDLGSGTLDVADADARFAGVAPGEHAGASLTANDVDGDGTLDLAIGATERSGIHSESGGVYLLLDGPTDDRSLDDADAVLVGESASARFGVLASGDLDFDGHKDLVVGADFESASGRDAGSVYVFFGDATWADAEASQADVVLRGEAAGDRLGISVAVAEPPTPGPARLVVASLFSDHGQRDGGAVYAFSAGLDGATDLSEAEAVFVGESPEDQIGFALQAEDDFNGDGYPELVIGAYAVDSVGTDAGSSYLFYGLGL